MEIGQFLVKSSASVSVNDAGVAKSQKATTSSFTEYMNSFLEVANEVKNNRRSKSFANVSQNDEYSAVKIEIGQKKIQTGFDKDITEQDELGAVDSNDFPLVPMTLPEKEAFERIAVLIADGSLDAESLGELTEEELDEIVEWVLAGAGGLFVPYAEDASELGMAGVEDIEDAEATETDSLGFGLADSVEALEQLQDLYSRIDDNTDGDVAAIGKLFDLEELSPVQIDKLAQAILKLVEESSQTAQGEVLTPADAVNLRDLLKDVPGDELLVEIQGVLEELGVDVEVPDMPEAVLKSLAIEVVNVNNKMIDAAELNSKLLDGLNNNAELREQILNSVSNREAGAELINAVSADPEVEVAETVLDDLAEAVLDDSSAEELEDLEGALKNDVADLEKTDSVINAGVADTAAGNESAEVEEETPTPGEVKTVDKDTIKNSEIEITIKNTDALSDTDNKKLAVKEETVQNTAEILPKESAKDSEKDVLTGRAFTGENTVSQEEGELGEESAEDDKGDNESFESDFEKKLIFKEETNSASKDSFSENFVDAETKMNFKEFTPAPTQSSYAAENPYVRYSEMIENMDRLSKLLISSSDKAMKSVTMELSPPELGKLTIEVSVKDGHASAAIKVETDGARQMLLNNIEQLKKNLESHGLKLENFEVELNKQGQQDRNQQSEFAQAQEDERNRRSRRRQNGINAGGSAVETEGENKALNKAKGSGISDDGTVDIVA